MRINKTMFTGNLTRDPELKYSSGGAAILNLGVAINNSYKKQDGDWVDKTCFMDVAVFGKFAESLNGRLRKGLEVYIEGSLEQEDWIDKNTGQKRYKHSIKAQTVQLTQKQESSQGQQQPQAAPSYRAPAQQPVAQSAPEPPPMTYQNENDEDIPF